MALLAFSLSPLVSLVFSSSSSMYISKSMLPGDGCPHRSTTMKTGSNFKDRGLARDQLCLFCIPMYGCPSPLFSFFPVLDPRETVTIGSTSCRHLIMSTLTRNPALVFCINVYFIIPCTKNQIYCVTRHRLVKPLIHLGRSRIRPQLAAWLVPFLAVLFSSYPEFVKPPGSGHRDRPLVCFCGSVLGARVLRESGYALCPTAQPP